MSDPRLMNGSAPSPAASSKFPLSGGQMQISQLQAQQMLQQFLLLNPSLSPIVAQAMLTAQIQQQQQYLQQQHLQQQQIQHQQQQQTFSTWSSVASQQHPLSSSTGIPITQQHPSTSTSPAFPAPPQAPVPPPIIFRANSETPHPPETIFVDASSTSSSSRKRKAGHSIERSRVRNSQGQFVSDKIQKTETLDLQQRLDSSEGEVAKLREQLKRRDIELHLLTRQLQRLSTENAFQKSQLEAMAMGHDAADVRAIRDYKLRMQYLQQIEQMQKDIAASGSNTPVGTPSIVMTPGPSMAMTPSVAPSMTMTPSAAPTVSTPMSIATPDPSMPLSEAEQLASELSSAAASRPRFEFEPWNTHIPRPFREKVDFSKIELKAVEPPPNLVEHARMEAYEGQRQWQKLQTQVERKKPREPYQAPHQPFSTKIDLNEKKSQLRKTTSQQLSQPTSPMMITPSSPSHSSSLQPFGVSPPDSGPFSLQTNHPIFEDDDSPFDLMMTDEDSMLQFGDSAYFDSILGGHVPELDFTLPTPTARIFQEEYMKKK